MSALAVGAAWVLRGYQWVVSPFLPSACRFFPTCSEYARQALLQLGFVRGCWLATRRFVRCHPFHPGGYDPVPAADKAQKHTLRIWRSEQSWPPP